MSLPDAWVERIWAAMRATYGAEFDRQWETPAGSDPAEHVRQLKAFWARELGPYFNAPDAIRYALENLPPRAPNLIEFKAVCRRAPQKSVPAIEGPKADPQRVAELLATIVRPKEAAVSQAQLCIQKLRTLHDRSGQKLTANQRHVLYSCERMLGLVKDTHDE